MLKLAALESHLAGADELHQRNLLAAGARAGKDNSRSSSRSSKHIRTQSWSSQAHDIAGQSKSKQQLSAYIYLEVKLAEALDRCDNICPPKASESGEPLPNKLRTAVCCKVLTELCTISGPFSRVLGKLKDELIHSIYSNYYAMEQTGLQFRQLPYFKAAERLEADNKHLTLEKEAFRKVLQRRQEEVGLIEGQVNQLKARLQQQEATNVILQQRTKSSEEAESRAKVEAGAAKDELKRLRKEMLRLKNEWTTLKALYESAKVSHGQAQQASDAQANDLKATIRQGVEEANELRAQLATVVPRQQLTNAESRIKELEKMVQQARRESTKADDLVRSLTPRPNWHKLDAAIHATSTPSAPPSTSTQQHAAQQSALQAEPVASTRELVDWLVTERKQALARVAELEPLQGQLQEALRLLEPEPCLGPVQLHRIAASPQPGIKAAEQDQSQPAGSPSSAAAVATAAPVASASRTSKASTGGHNTAAAKAESAVVFTDATASSAATGSSHTSAATAGAAFQQFASGLGWSGVPRYLRWEGPIALQPMTLPALQSMLHQIWSAKAASDAEQQVQQSLQSFIWRFFRAKHAQQGLVAAAGYSLLHALQQHQAGCAMAGMFVRVLEGRWQEAMWHDCRHMLQAVSLILQALSDAQPEGVHSMVSVIDIQLVLQHMFPHKSESDITTAIRAVSTDSHVTISALMPMQRRSGQWEYSTASINQFTEALQQQYIINVDSRIASLQQHFSADASVKLSVSFVKSQLCQWDHSLPEPEVEGVMQDLAAQCAAREKGHVSILVDEVQLADLLCAARLHLSWLRLHNMYDFAGTLSFVRNLHESDVGIHSTGELPDIA